MRLPITAFLLLLFSSQILFAQESNQPEKKKEVICYGCHNATKRALYLPKPEYPKAARAVNASGAVSVSITIDENGNVIEAKAVSGHPLFWAVSVKAALKAKFAPTKVSGVPVKIYSFITYNFVPSEPAQSNQFVQESTQPEPEPKRKPKEIRVGVVNKRARYIPKPVLSRGIKATGEVKVEIAVDMSGKVISAQAVSGNPLLRPAAEASAGRASFAPTLIVSTPIVVIGYLVYNFKSGRKIEY